MLRFGLKTKFSINLLIILLIAMLMLDFVMMMITRQALTKSGTEKTAIVITAIQTLIDAKGVDTGRSLESDLGQDVRNLFEVSGVACGHVYDTRFNSQSLGKACRQPADLTAYARKAVANGRSNIDFIGSTWGIFWRMPEYMVIATVLNPGGSYGGAICLLYDMAAIYAALRKTQKVLFYYIVVNAFLLTFLGVYRLWQITGRPLQKLVRRADEFQPDGDLMFLSDDDESEFSRLSRSLNHMLENIEADKKKLKSTVLSLESTNAQLKKAHAEILRAEKMASVGRLSSGIAHEIGNPIGIVLGYLDLLRQENLPAQEKADFIERALGEINRINNIIKELLDFARPARNVKQVVAVHAILEEIVTMLQQQPMMKDIQIELDLVAEAHTIVADPQRLRQVFLNLLINASDAIHQEPADGGGCIRIESRNPQSKDGPATRLQVAVEDNGSGIPAEELKNIFDPFYTTKEPGKGTGLGLSVSFMIVEETGGTLRAAAPAEKGTRFLLSFPCNERNLSE